MTRGAMTAVVALAPMTMRPKRGGSWVWCAWLLSASRLAAAAIISSYIMHGRAEPAPAPGSKKEKKDTKGKGEARKEKKKKDPNEPKRAKSAYLLFCDEVPASCLLASSLPCAQPPSFAGPPAAG